MMRWNSTLHALPIALAIGAAGNALGQEYPNRPVRLIVPHAAGGSNDILARMIAPRLTDALGQQVVVDNRAGAGAIIGTALVARAAPDGYTLLLADAPHGANPALHSKLPYDTLRDFDAISLIALMPSILITHPSVPVASVAELIALAKSKPGQLNYASAGVGSSIYLTMALFIDRTGINVFHVSYKSGAPALVDLIAGQVQMQFVNVPPAVQHVRAGRVKPLGVTSSKRVALLPEVPTVGESGVPGFEDYQWQGIVGPAKLPAATVSRLSASLAKVLAEPDVRERVTGSGAEVVAGNPQQLAEFIKVQVRRWSEVIKPGMRID
jgi:tripartite-type tricarboxylate transporter receptor subunit TctC